MGISILSKVIPLRFLSNPVHFLALGFGSGLSPYAPGTMGTLVAIPLYLMISQLSLMVYLLVVVVGFVVGVYLCGQTSKALGVHDHSGIVWDEIIGYWITMIAIPEVNWQWIIAGFVLFRIFDIAKPWPVKSADQNMRGGFGIMFDDVLAGIYALICLQVANYFLGYL